MLVTRNFVDGPLQGHQDTRDVDGVEANLAIDGGRDGVAYHYRLVHPLPDVMNEPLMLNYRFVRDFDPRTRYMEREAERQLRGG